MMTDVMITDQMISDAKVWYEKLSTRPVTEDKRAAFRLWFEQNPAHQQAYAHVFMCGDENISIPSLPEVVLLDAVKPANDGSMGPKAMAQNANIRHNSFALKWGAVAAALFVAILGLNIYFAAPETQEYSTQIAEVRNILLEDGTHVTLGPSSQILVAKFTGDERRVFLEKGEAFFDVAHNPDKPFTVESGRTEIQVLGTKFNMNRTIDYLAVSLLEGKIEIQQERDGGLLPFFNEEETITLLPAQMVTVKKGILSPPEGRKIKQMANWVEGKLNYINIPLRVVIADANRYSRFPLRIEDKSLESLPVTAVFGTDQIDIMIRGLSQILPITVTRGADGSYIIKSKRTITGI